MENENEVVVPQTNEQTVETQEASAEEQQQFSEAEKKAYARAKVAEAKARELKAKVKALEEEKLQNKQTPTVPEELKLIARGLSDEEIDQAKVISKGKGITLTEALKDPLFLAYQDKAQEEKRKADAKLGASKGSSQTVEQASISGMSREEHMKHWKESIG